ncbi:DnaT-like ssDNA-binding domain-containing protein [Tomitella gaofuii]|uniref:DnaT-like ssDNA-binding domain-containing protein n=1 Tax=Tomitella gaofuii TaxID=2760083 RepID=UPI0015FA6B00
MVSELSGTAKLADALVAAGLWERCPGGFVFAQWSKYNPTAEQVRSDRQASAVRQRRRRRRADGTYDGAAADETKPTVTSGAAELSRRDTSVSHGGSHGVSHGGSASTPTRPDPTNKERDRGGNGAEARATTIPDDWTPTPEVASRMASEHPGINQEMELAKFRDYWAGVGGSRGRKKNWDATFRNWIRNAAQYQAERKPAGRRVIAGGRWEE